MVHRQIHLTAPLLLALLLLPLAGCPRVVRETQPGNAPDPGASIPTVTVERPKYKAIQRVIEQPAFVEAYEETPLIAGIPGFVGKVHADIGQVFDKDGKLAELSVPELVQDYKQKEALVADAEAKVTQAEAALKAAEAYVKTREALIQEAKAGKAR